MHRSPDQSVAGLFALETPRGWPSAGAVADPVEGTDVPNPTVLRSECTATRRDGSFCERATLPDAPFPICVRHAAEVLRYLNSVIPDGDDAATTATRDPEPPADPLLIHGDGVSLVYYIRIGQYIKIGHTINLHQRVRFYPPDAELMAYEYGDRPLEQRRLRQFLRDRRERLEWFSPSDELLAHVARLRADLFASHY